MIEIKNIEKNFGNNHVLKNVSFLFERGKTNLIIGESGSGKTTLIKVLIGLHKIDSGIVLFDGVDFNAIKTKEQRLLRQEIGMLFQGGALYDYMSVEENIMFPLNMFTEKTEIEKLERVNLCLKRVKLEGKNGLMPSELSGGMTKRVAIARAVINEPKLIFADEPTGNLDCLSTKAILEVISQLNIEFGVSFVLVTHDHNAAAMMDRILSLEKGILGSKS